MELIKKITLTCLITLLSYYCNSQSIKGVISDGIDPIPFSNIYLLNKSSGVIASADGSFEFVLNPDTNDSIVFSSLGYKKLILPPKYFKFNQINSIVLKPDSTLLKEVTIYETKNSTKELNYFKESKMSFGAAQPGFESATFIPNNKNYSGFIKDVSVYVKNIGYPTAPFRVHIYELNMISNEPGQELTEKNLIANAMAGDEWVTVNLDSLNIAIPAEGFFVCIEALPFYRYKAPSQLGLDSIRNELFKGNLTGFQKILHLGTQSHLKKHGLVAYSRYYLHSWNLAAEPQYCIAVKATLSYHSKGRNKQKIKNDDSIHVIIEKRSGYLIKKVIRDNVKYDDGKYPHNTIKEFFESNVKAINNNEIPYLFKFLYVVSKEEKDSFLNELEERAKQEHLFSKQEIANGLLFFKYALNNINESKLNYLSDDLYVLTMPNQSSIVFLKKRGKWFANPGTIDLKKTKRTEFLYK